MKNFIRSTVLAATAALGVLGMGTAASAATITATSATISAADVGTSWEVNFICSAALPCNGGSPTGTLGAKVIFTVWDVLDHGSSMEWIMKVSIRNTSNLVAGGFLTAIGFATDPNVLAAGGVTDFWQGNSDGHDWTGGTGSIPGFSGTELCLWGGNNCSAANDHYMTPGVTDSVGFSINTALTNSLTFTDFAARWAGNNVTGGSFDAGGTIKVAPVPLPAAGGLLLLALGGLVALRRGRKAL